MKRFTKKFSGRKACSKGVSSVERVIMPVFTFEKISPPLRNVPPVAQASEKPRSRIVRILDRFVEARVKRTLMTEKADQPPRRKPAE
jgi:hypothetical protein